MIYKYDLKGNFVEKFIGGKEAAKSVNGVASGVTMAARGDSLQYKGFIWTYDENGIDIEDKIEAYHKVIKRVKQYDKDGNFIKSHNSVLEAAQIIKYSKCYNISKSIHKCCQKEQYTAYGFIWRYENDDEMVVTRPKYKYAGQRYPIKQYTLEGKFVASYFSVKEAARQTGISTHLILQCIKGKQKSGRGFVWKKVE